MGERGVLALFSNTTTPPVDMHLNQYVLLFCSLCWAFHVDAQKQYWGGVPSSGLGSDPLGSGGIIRVDSNALHSELVVPFDTTGNLGAMNSGSRLLLANNGRLYGISVIGSNDGKLFWIDPVTDSLHIAVTFNTPQYPQFGTPAYWSSLMETSTGMIVGATGGSTALDPATLFKFDPITESISQIASLPSTICGDGQLYLSDLQGTPYEASDGYLYAYSPFHACKGDQLVRIDPTLSTVTYHLLNNIPDGYPINGDNFLERNDTLYMTAYRGGPGDDLNSGVNGRGAIRGFSLNTLNDFAIRGYTDSIHNPWTGLVAAPDGKWYGEAMGPLWNGGGFGLYADTLCIYRYDPATNELEHLRNNGTPPYDASVIGGPNLGSLLAASNGKLYGAFRNGLWEYDAQADSFTLRAPLQHFDNGNIIGHGPTGALTEICRKPNYKPRSTTSFNVCAGAHFFYDLQNVNATGIVWRRNGTIVPDQTSQRLEFTAITEGDEGVWTCILTNECGVTEPPAVTIYVNAGAFTTSTISGDALLCGTGDVVTLSGNNSGTWAGPSGSAANGTIAPSAMADLEGTYYVWHTQACGQSLSNAIAIMHLDSAEAPYQILPGNPPGEYAFCPNDPFVFTNDPGPWGNLPTGIWMDGSTASTYTALDTGYVYVTSSNACNSDTSGIYHVVLYNGPVIPPLQVTDLPFGPQVDMYLCADDSLYLSVSGNDNFYLHDASWQYLASLGGGVFGVPYMINNGGTYYLTNYACVGPSDTLTIIVYADSAAPTNTLIVPDQVMLTGCDQDTAYLSTTTSPAYWTWYDGLQFHQDTTVTLLVDWSVGLYTLTSFNGCGEGPQDGITIAGTPSPDVFYNEPEDTLCLNGGTITLAPGSPAGGTHSGPGVSNGVFNPQQAGIGEHTITYEYSDGTCSGYAQEVLVVDICDGLLPLIPEEPGVRVFPNPNNGHFIIQIPVDLRHAEARLFNSLGQEVMAPVRLSTRVTTIHKDHLPVGVHTLRIAVDGRAHTVRLVITR